MTGLLQNSHTFTLDTQDPVFFFFFFFFFGGGGGGGLN